jgi:hypothetical protein
MAPAIRTDGPSPRIDADEATEAGDELGIGERRRRFTTDVALATVQLVASREIPPQAFADGPRTEDQQLVSRRQAGRDVGDESREMLEAVRFAGRLRAPPAMPDGGIVPDMTGRSVVSRHLRFHSFDPRPVALPPDDDSLAGVDPDKRCRGMV